MATAYLAEDRKHDRKVAVKVLRPELSLALVRRSLGAMAPEVDRRFADALRQAGVE